MNRSRFVVALVFLIVALAAGDLTATAEDLPPVSAEARRVHDAGMLFDGHNDLPWRLRKDGDVGFTTLDIGKRLTTGQTDIPRMRAGGLKAQFWSVYIPSDHPNPARTVTEQIDLVHRMIERYPDDLTLALTADDVERAVKAGKVACLIGIEGGVAIENDLAQLRAFARLGARYMTLTHNTSLDWADSARDAPRCHGLSPFGERVVREMNRLGMLVDISHVSAETMRAAIKVSKAPVIASHSSAYAVAAHPRNVPDDVLGLLPANGGVVMVNFYSGFIVPEYAATAIKVRKAMHAQHPDEAEFAKAFAEFERGDKLPRGTVGTVADHIDHIRKVAGIDHVGIGSDFDGITAWPVGLEDVADFPRLTEELLRRGYSEADVHKVLGGNVLRALRKSGEVAAELQRTTRPEVDTPAIRLKD